MIEETANPPVNIDLTQYGRALEEIEVALDHLERSPVRLVEARSRYKIALVVRDMMPKAQRGIVDERLRTIRQRLDKVEKAVSLEPSPAVETRTQAYAAFQLARNAFIDQLVAEGETTGSIVRGLQVSELDVALIVMRHRHPLSNDEIKG